MIRIQLAKLSVQLLHQSQHENWMNLFFLVAQEHFEREKRERAAVLQQISRKAAAVLVWIAFQSCSKELSWSLSDQKQRHEGCTDHHRSMCGVRWSWSFQVNDLERELPSIRDEMSLMREQAALNGPVCTAANWAKRTYIYICIYIYQKVFSLNVSLLLATCRSPDQIRPRLSRAITSLTQRLDIPWYLRMGLSHFAPTSGWTCQLQTHYSIILSIYLSYLNLI